MTRTQRIVAAINAEIMRHQDSIDGGEWLRELTLTVRLNEAGFPKSVRLQPEFFTDLTEAVRPA